MSRKSERKSRHLTSPNADVGRGNPSASSGRIGEQKFNNIPGEGIVHMVRTGLGWQKMSTSKGGTSQGDSKADIPVATISAATSTTGAGGGTTTDSHTGLLNLDADDHTQYVHNTIARTVTAAHTFSGNTAFTGVPTFTNIDVNGGSITGITDLAVADGGTGVSNSNSWLNSRITTSADGSLNYDATTAVAVNHDSLAGFVGNKHIDHSGVSITAGTGLTGGGTIASSRTLNVVGGTCITANADDIQVTDDSIGDTQLAYNTGQHLTTTSSPQFSNMTMGEWDDPNYSNGNIGTAQFASGFTGSGWKIDKDGNEYNFEADNMTIRGTLSVYELLIQQIRATNGSIFVSACAKVDTVTGSAYTETIVFEDPSDHGVCPFVAGDILLCQRVRLDSTTLVKRHVREVDSVNGKTIVCKATASGPNDVSSTAIEPGDDFVRLGNSDTSNYSNRQGGVYLTADDSNAPFIDVFDDVTSWATWTGFAKTKARLGKLDGITDTTAGLDGNQANLYGLYSDDVYLKGHINATTGKIGGVNLSNSSVYVGSDGYGHANQTFYLGNDGKFSLKDKLKWSGSTLEITGDISVTNTGDFADTDADNTANNETFDSTDATRCVVSSTGLEVKNSSATSLAVFGASMRVGKVADDHSRLEIDSSGNLSIINRQGSTDTTTISLSNAGNASFTGAVTATSGTFTGAVNASSGNITGALTVKDTITVGTASNNGAIKLYGNSGTGGKIHTSGKESFTDGTGGFFLGYDGDEQYDLFLGDNNNHIKWDGSASTMTIRGTLNADDINAGTLTGRTVRTAASGDRIVMDGGANSISLIDANDYSRVVIDDNDNAPDDNPGYNQIISHATDQNHTGSWTDGNYGTWTHPKGRQCQVRIELYSVQSDVTAYVKVMGYAGSSWYQLAYDSHSFSSSGQTQTKYLHYSSGTATSFKIQVYGEHDEGGFGTPSATLHMYVREYKQASYLNHTGMHWVGNGIYARLGPNTEQLPTAMASNSDIDGDDAFVCTGNAHLYKKLIFSSHVGTSETSRWTMKNESGSLYFRKYGSTGNAVTGLGYLGSSNIGAIDFTGQHRCIGNSGMTAAQYGAMIGYIVRADGKYNNISDNGTSASINESLPVIELSDSNNDKRVYGVISSHEDNNREYQQGTFVTVYDIPENDERVIINSLGEGGIWVTNLNGNLENGDYITTSTAAGLGQKQDDDVLHSYTVAKITQDCDFSAGTEFEHSGQTYKKQFVGCTYHCG